MKNLIVALFLTFSLISSAQTLVTNTWLTGNKRSEGYAIDGKETGKWTFWYKDGKKYSEGIYENEIGRAHV